MKRFKELEKKSFEIFCKVCPGLIGISLMVGVIGLFVNLWFGLDDVVALSGSQCKIASQQTLAPPKKYFPTPKESRSVPQPPENKLDHFAMGQCIQKEDWDCIWQIDRIGTHNAGLVAVKKAEQRSLQSYVEVGDEVGRSFDILNNLYREVPCP